MSNRPPDEIKQLMAGNPGRLKANLQKFWRQTAEDLIAAGVSAELVADSLLSAAIFHQIKVRGQEHASRFLRNMADLQEGPKK